MAKGKTLWEMFVEKFQSPMESKVYNPLRAKIGSGVMIDDVERRDLNFFVKEIREYRRNIGPKEFTFADYVLLAKPLGKEEVLARLRINPGDDSDQTGVPYQVLLLCLSDDLAYDEGLHNVVKEATGKFEVRQDVVVQEEYWRINDVKSPYKAQVSVVQDTDQDKQAEKSEVEHLKLEYWDYWREVPDAAGQPVNEFLFVEMNQENGWFQIWKGMELDPRRVMVFEAHSTAFIVQPVVISSETCDQIQRDCRSRTT